MKYYAITDKKTSYCVRKLFMNTRSSKVMIHFRKVQSWALAGGGGTPDFKLVSCILTRPTGSQNAT